MHLCAVCSAGGRAASEIEGDDAAAATSFTSTLTQPATPADPRGDRGAPSALLRARSRARTVLLPRLRAVLLRRALASGGRLRRRLPRRDPRHVSRRPRAAARGLRLEMDKCWPYPTRKRVVSEPNARHGGSHAHLAASSRSLLPSRVPPSRPLRPWPRRTVTVPGTAEGFQPTGITVSPGHPVQLTATGNIDYGCNNFNGCAGDPERRRPERRGLPGRGAAELPGPRPADVQPRRQGRRRRARSSSARARSFVTAGDRPADASPTTTAPGATTSAATRSRWPRSPRRSARRRHGAGDAVADARRAGDVRRRSPRARARTTRRRPRPT